MIEKVVGHQKKCYQFRTRLYRLNDREQLRLILDNPHLIPLVGKFVKKNDYYIGTIKGMDIELKYDTNCLWWLYGKTEEDLKKAKNIAINRLSGIEDESNSKVGSNGRSLKDILGIK